MSDLTHIFSIGQKVKCAFYDEFEVIMYNGRVKEVYEDHIIVDVPKVSDHCWFEKDFNIDSVYPDYNFA